MATIRAKSSHIVADGEMLLIWLRCQRPPGMTSRCGQRASPAVAGALRMSQGKVHAVCGEVRALRRGDADAANFPSMTLGEFEKWMERGKRPKRLDA